jgi:predicted dehydrogenase
VSTRESANAGASGTRIGDPGRVSRRRFLKGTAAAALGLGPLAVPRHVLGGKGNQAPSDTLRIAAIGVGGMGRHYLAGCKGERIVALCDLDHRLAAPAFKEYPAAARYHDFRTMLDEQARNLDAIIVATPDHTHTIIVLAAFQLGKHVYCAKPITHTIGEARKVREAARKAPRLVTKSSVQSSGIDAARSTTELLRSGVIGSVRELHVWCDHPVYPCSLLRPTEAQTPPPGMDWDLWLGPAPLRPYHSAYHPWRWRPWWEFGTGTVGDMGCHTFHVYFNELQLAAPKAVYGYGSVRREGLSDRVPTPECQSRANMVTWEFPARGDLPPLLMHWYDGGMKPHRPVELDHAVRLPRSGLLFVGEKGKLLAGYSGGGVVPGRGLRGGLLLPEEKFRDVAEPPKRLQRVEDHYGEWARACKTGARTVCPIEFGCEMTELALLGTLALRMGSERLLEWDAGAMRVVNDEEANRFVDPPYRTGWSL